MPDPINALQNLASQGSRNAMQSQMMSMGGPMGPAGSNQNTNVLQNLIHVILFADVFFFFLFRKVFFQTFNHFF